MVGTSLTLGKKYMIGENYRWVKEVAISWFFKVQILKVGSAARLKWLWGGSIPIWTELYFYLLVFYIILL